MSFVLYLVGFFVMLAGLGYGADLLHVPDAWIIVGALVVVGAGVMSAGSHIKRQMYPGDTPRA
jgi:hypothetical protein